LSKAFFMEVATGFPPESLIIPMMILPRNDFPERFHVTWTRLPPPSRGDMAADT